MKMNRQFQRTTFIAILMGVMWIDADAFTSITDSQMQRKTLLGFPVGITCADAFKRRSDSRTLQGNDTVQCEITSSDGVLFNKTIQWERSSVEGIFFDAEKDLNFTVSAVWKDGNSSLDILLLVNAWEEPNCEKPGADSDRVSAYLGNVISLACIVPRELRNGMSEEQFAEIDAVWYKGCQEMKRNDSSHTYLPAQYRRRRFDGIRIHDASFETSPGTYQCVLQYKGKTIVAEEVKVCVKERSDHNLPLIVSKRDEYDVHPGQDLTLECYGYGRDLISRVYWGRKESDTALCYASQYFSGDRPCTHNVTVVQFCEPANESEIAEAKMKKSGSFISTFTLRDVSYNDSGVYFCTLINVGRAQTDYFNITVRDDFLTTLLAPATLSVIIAVPLVVILLMVGTAMFLCCFKTKKNQEISNNHLELKEGTLAAEEDNNSVEQKKETT